jgi:Beta-lactamase class C and other penicillin binding proteins
MKPFLVSISILFILSACNANTRQKPETPARKIQNDLALYPQSPATTAFVRLANEVLAETHIPGAAIAIVVNNKLELLKGFGVKNIGTTDSVDEHTVFRIASVSKGFASMLAGILVKEKLINWDDPVRKYLPQFHLKDPSNSNRLTIRHILSHTSGLPTHTFTNLIEQKVSYTTLRDNLSTIESTAPPGTVFAYQNVIYSLISDIAQAATHKTYEELLTEKIFHPLNMIDASASYAAIKSCKNLALPHFRRSATTFKTTQNSPEYYSVLPAAGVNASISDMARWLMALLDNKKDVIDSAVLSEIYKPEIETPRRRRYEFFHWPQLKKAHYGMGWRVLNYGGHTLIYHGGHVNGYRSEVGFCPETKTGIVILTNATGKLANDGVEEFFDLYFGFKKPQLKKEPIPNEDEPPAEDSL